MRAWGRGAVGPWGRAAVRPCGRGAVGPWGLATSGVAKAPKECGAASYGDRRRIAANLAAASPDVPVVLEHLGLPNVGHDPDLAIWRAGVAALLERFGPARCLFGSNFPVERLAGGFVPLCDLIREALGERAPGERADVVGDTARRFYRLGAG